MASGALVAVAAAHSLSLLPESLRPIPAAFAGAFGSLFLNLHVGGAIAALMLMFVSYAAVVALSGQLSARVVLMAIGVVHALVLLGPPLASTDAFSYQAYARMGATYAINPYTHAPAAINLDPVYPYIGAKWSLHAERLRAGVHRLQLSAGPADGRDQRVRLQGHRRAGQPRAGGSGVALRPPARYRPGQGGGAGRASTRCW